VTLSVQLPYILEYLQKKKDTLNSKSPSRLQTTWHTVVVDFHDGSQGLDFKTQFSQGLYLNVSPKKARWTPVLLSGTSWSL